MKKRNEGYVLIIVVVLLAGAFLLAASFLGMATSGERIAGKTQQRDAAVTLLETRMATRLRAVSNDLLAADLSVGATALGRRLFASNGESGGTHQMSGHAEMTDRSSAFEPGPFALADADTLPSSTLRDSDDPFQQAPARVSIMRLDAQMTPTGYVQSVASDGLDSRPVRARLAFNFRSMPSSAFSLLSNGGAVLLTDGTSPEVGRIYARRELGVQGSVRVGGTVVAGERLNVEGDLTVETRQGSYRFRGNSDSTEWLNQSRLAPEAVVLTGRDLPAGISLPAPIDQQFAQQQPWAEPSLQKQQALAAHADLVAVDDGATVLLYDAQGTRGVANDGLIEIYESPNYTSGRIIRVDYSKLSSDRRQLALSVQASDPNAIVLITNAEALRGPLTIVTTLPIYVAGELNVGNDYAVSLISRQRVMPVESWF